MNEGIPKRRWKAGLLENLSYLSCPYLGAAKQGAKVVSSHFTCRHRKLQGWLPRLRSAPRLSLSVCICHICHMVFSTGPFLWRITQQGSLCVWDNLFHQPPESRRGGAEKGNGRQKTYLVSVSDLKNQTTQTSPVIVIYSLGPGKRWTETWMRSVGESCRWSLRP